MAAPPESETRTQGHAYVVLDTADLCTVAEKYCFPMISSKLIYWSDPPFHASALFENPSLSPYFSFALWLPFSAGSIYLQFLVGHLFKSAGDWTAAQQWYLHSIVPIFWLLF